VPIQANADIWLRLYEDDVLIESVPWASRLSVVRTYPDRTASRCYRSGIFIDLDRDGVEETVEVGDNTYFESGQGSPHCTVGQGLWKVTTHATPEVADPEFDRVRAEELPPQ
jgi:hypothetical protein